MSYIKCVYVLLCDCLLYSLILALCTLWCNDDNVDRPEYLLECFYFFTCLLALLVSIIADILPLSHIYTIQYIHNTHIEQSCVWFFLEFGLETNENILQKTHFFFALAACVCVYVFGSFIKIQNNVDKLTKRPSFAAAARPYWRYVVVV